MSKFIGSEIRPGEKFLWNTRTDAEFPPKGFEFLKTLRRGDIALDIDGNRIPPDHMRPVFIHESESDAHNRICQTNWERLTARR